MDQAARGSKALDGGRYDEAIKEFTAAIAIHPTSPDYHIKRSTAYQRISPPNLDAALHDAEKGVLLAIERQKRETVTQAQFRRAIVLFRMERYGDSRFLFDIVRQRNPKENLSLWDKQLENKLQALSGDDPKLSVTVPEIPDVKKRSEDSPQLKDAKELGSGSKPAAPAPMIRTPARQIRTEWYQSSNTVYLTLLAKGVPKDEITVEFKSDALNVSFPTSSASSFEFTLDPLYASIDPTASNYTVTPSKVEISLRKQVPQKWAELEAKEREHMLQRQMNSQPTPNSTSSGPAYPTSSRTGAKDWDKLAKMASNPGEGDEDLDGDPVQNFFKTLYADSDANTRRAMAKSFQESNGTVLSTNWKEVGSGKVQTTPPDGMVEKKWDE